MAPPKRLIAASVLRGNAGIPLAVFRPQKPETTCMGNNAMVDVMLAARGSRPAIKRAGKVRKDPPPAMVFVMPAMKKAAVSRILDKVNIGG